MSRPVVRRGAAVAALLSVASLASAAEGKRPGRYRFGPFYASPRLVLQNAGFDSNVFAQGNNPVSDTVVLLSPSLELAPAGDRLRLSGVGSLNFSHFVEQASERSTDSYATGRAEVDFLGGRVTLIGGGGRGRFRERFAFEEQERVRRTERHVSAGLSLKATSRLSAGVFGVRRVYEFDPGSTLATEIKETLDRTSFIGSLEARYAVTRSTSLALSWDDYRDRFEHQIGAAPSEVRSSRLLAGVEAGRRAIVRGKVMAGVRRFPGEGGVAPYDGLAYAASVTAPLGENAQLVGLADRDVLFGVNRAGSVFDQRRSTYEWTRYRAGLTLELPFDLVARGLVGREHARFLLPFERDGVSVSRVDRLWTANGSLMRRINHVMRVGLTLDWEHRSSNFVDSAYGRVRYGVQAELVP